MDYKNFTESLLVKIFRTLYEIQIDEMDKGEYRDSIDEINYLFNYGMPIESQLIERLFLETGSDVISTSQKRKFLYLPFMEEEFDFIPVMTFEYERENENLKLRVIFLKLAKKSNGDRTFHKIGFRFEKGENIHNYYHVQLITSFEGTSPIFPGQYEVSYPEEQPAIPIVAKDSISLLVNLLISLYGKKYCLNRLVKEHQIKELNKYLT